MGKNVRIQYLDVAKGILIMLLLVSHFGIALEWGGQNDTACFVVPLGFCPLFIKFFMQAFFFISGYCTSFDRTAGDFAYRQFKELVVPLLFFSVVEWLLVRYEHYPSGDSDIFDRLWFIDALLVAKLLVWAFNRAHVNIPVTLFLSLVCLAAGVGLNEWEIGDNVFCYWHGLTAVPFVALGLISKKKQILNHSKVFVIGAIVYVMLIVLSVFSGRYWSMPGVDAHIAVLLVQIPLFLIFSVSGIFFFLGICKLIKHNSWTEYFGRQTLLIYCTHMWFYYRIVGDMLSIYTPQDRIGGFLFFCLAFAIELFVMFILSKLFELRPLKYILGKW
jgi:fucose 4-O-acetylase-like acetyltransferase